MYVAAIKSFSLKVNPKQKQININVPLKLKLIVKYDIGHVYTDLKPTKLAPVDPKKLQAGHELLMVDYEQNTESSDYVLVNMLLTLIRSIEYGSIITFKFDLDSKEYAKEPLDFDFKFEFFNRVNKTN